MVTPSLPWDLVPRPARFIAKNSGALPQIAIAEAVERVSQGVVDPDRFEVTLLLLRSQLLHFVPDERVYVERYFFHRHVETLADDAAIGQNQVSPERNRFRIAARSSEGVSPSGCSADTPAAR